MFVQARSNLIPASARILLDDVAAGLSRLFLRRKRSQLAVVVASAALTIGLPAQAATSIFEQVSPTPAAYAYGPDYGIPGIALDNGIVFGPRFVDVTAQIANVAGSGGIHGLSTGCEIGNFGSDVVGKIALVSRGGCQFVEKAFAAQQAGALAVLIADDNPVAHVLDMSGNNPNVSITAFRLSYDLGALFAQQTLTATTTVRMAVGDGLVSNIPPVPEPATWAMMLGGFAATGGLLRKRRRTAGANINPATATNLRGKCASLTQFFAVAFGMLAAAFGATSAQADNEYTSLYARTCSPYIVGNCESGFSNVGLAAGLNVGGGYAFASGWHGGYTLASAVFAPGAGPLLQAGLYSNGSLSDYYFSFQVVGAPNTLVPLHMFARVSASAIHMTDETGNVANLIDGTMTVAPSDQFKVVAGASMQVASVRSTPYPVSGGAISVESRYLASAFDDGASCMNCDGAGVVLDSTIWVWSNSDINVHLNANTLLEYTALGGGLDPLSLFATVSVEADPVFTIDDPAYSGFSVVGVPTGAPPPGNSAVPEPAAWALMIFGFAVVGGAVRRKTSAVIPLSA